MTSSSKNTIVDIGKLVEWPRELITPAELARSSREAAQLRLVKSPSCSRVVLQIVGSWAYLMANVLNKSTVYNAKVFKEEWKHIEQVENDELHGKSSNLKKRPLLTYSNHISCIDDPVLWGSLLPLTVYSTKPNTVRWSPAATDICFSKRWHSTFFSLGKTFPIIRGVGLDQPAVEFANYLLHHNQWLHLFPEGRVMRDKNQQKISNLDRGYIFKWGISKLIMDYLGCNNHQETHSEQTNKREISILPFYHTGLDEILPIGWPYIPRFNKHIRVFIRPKAIKLNLHSLSEIFSSRTLSESHKALSRTREEVNRIKLTNYLEEELEKIIASATQYDHPNSA